MGARGFALRVQGEGENYKGSITAIMVLTCVVASMGGLIFGFDIFLSGGLFSRKDFIIKFFPSEYEKMFNERTSEGNEYCISQSQLLTLFSSSLYIVALIASLFASSVTRAFGRKASMFIGGFASLFGSLVSGSAVNVKMLILGRFLLGFGVGFSNQSTLIYLSEMAPVKARGAISTGFQAAVTIGILLASLANYYTAQIKGGRGWRICLALSGIPALILIIGLAFLPETPNSLLERGHLENAKQILRRFRGTQEVEEEFQDLIGASEAAKRVEQPWKSILTQPRYRPQLVLCILIPCFQQLTGINVVMFYTPLIFKILDFAAQASVLSTVMSSFVNILATIVSIHQVDRLGRKALLHAGGTQMSICLVALGMLIGLKFGHAAESSLSRTDANLILLLICVYVASFAWSWGPLGWILPTEICPLETRSAGQSISVSINMLFTCIIDRFFVSMLCTFKFGLFFIFAGFVIIMTIFTRFLLPETKNIPIEGTYRIWKEHWFWGKYLQEDSDAFDGYNHNDSGQFLRNNMA